METSAEEKLLRIERLAFGGDGIGPIDGKLCFVPGTIPGETVKVRITTEKKNFSRGILAAVAEPSPSRIAPACPLALRPGVDPADCCPGCCYQHLDYREEVRGKHLQLTGLLSRLAGVTNPEPLPPLASPAELGYRNKLTLHAQHGPSGAVLGYFRADNTTVLDLPACPLAVAPINARLAEERRHPDNFADGVSLTLRWTAADGVTAWRNAPGPDLPPLLRETTPCGEMQVPPGSFFQINTAASGLLMTTVRDLMAELQPECFVDLYCGAGFFSRAAASAGVPRVIGIENDPAAARTAELNLRECTGCEHRFLTGRVEKSLASLSRRKLPERTALLVDPPRGGLDPEALRRLTELAAADLIYVSCAADTMCRDLKKLFAAGYALQNVRLVDMFPRTAHFETVAWLKHERS